MTIQIRFLIIPLIQLSILVGGFRFTYGHADELPSLRVLTYNIHHGEGTDGKFDLERLAKVIAELNPDVVALQEVDRGTRRASGQNQSGELAKRLKMHHVFGNALYYSGGEYGEAILSRFPLSDAKSHHLPFQFGQEPRTALEVTITPDNGLPEFLLVGTHLCHQSEETRLEQTRELNQLFHDRKRPVIIAGDLNARPNSAPMQVLLKNNWIDVVAPKSRIDYILTRRTDPWKVTETRIDKQPLASDHDPVLATFQITEKTSSTGTRHNLGQSNQDRQLLWQDEFDQTGGLDKQKWSRCKRRKSDWNHYMSERADLVEVSDGKLVLHAIVNPEQTSDPVPYLTGGVHTREKFSYTRGKIEIRAKISMAKGAWPALWLMPDRSRQGKKPTDYAEIDLMEHLNDDAFAYQTIHTHHTLHGGGKKQGYSWDTASIDPGEFNTYGAIWNEDKVTLTVNGKTTFNYPRDPAIGTKQFPFTKPMYIIMSMQVEGSWVGKANPDDYPTEMSIDWIRVFRPGLTTP